MVGKGISAISWYLRLRRQQAMESGERSTNLDILLFLVAI